MITFVTLIQKQVWLLSPQENLQLLSLLCAKDDCVKLQKGWSNRIWVTVKKHCVYRLKTTYHDMTAKILDFVNMNKNQCHWKNTLGYFLPFKKKGPKPIHTTGTFHTFTITRTWQYRQYLQVQLLHRNILLAIKVALFLWHHQILTFL